MKNRTCELCDHHAALYCASDSAFLCFRCDSRVHGANFLVARHLRQPLCFNCNALTGDDPICGREVAPNNAHWLCSSCSPEEDFSTTHDEGSNSSSLSSTFDSACVSSTESLTKVSRSESSMTDSKYSYDVPARISGSFTKKRVQRWRAPSVDSRAEGTFLCWCNNLGIIMSGDSAAVASSASHALGFFLQGRLPGVPLRVSLAASFWLGVRLVCGNRAAAQNLKRVEEISGVPAKLILAVDVKLRRELRVVRRAARPELEEGWAEC